MKSTYDSGTYITKNLDRLNASSLEDLVAQRIWKTKKGSGYKYQHFDHISEEHLHNAINSFLKTNNHIVLDALYNELKHRKNKADEIKQKIKNTMNNTSYNAEPVQTEFGFDQTNTATAAAKAAETLNKTENQNYLPQEFFKDQVIKGYTVVDVESTNNRGYVLIVRKEGEENTMRISQSKFREKVGMRVYNKKKVAKQKAPKAKAVKQHIQQNNAKKIIEQKYQIGDVVGSYQILDVMRSNKGIHGGFKYRVKDKYGKKKAFWIKQSRLGGNVVNVIKKQPATIDDYSGEAAKQPAANTVNNNINNQPADIKAEIKKLSFFDKIKVLFS